MKSEYLKKHLGLLLATAMLASNFACFFTASAADEIISTTAGGVADMERMRSAAPAGMTVKTGAAIRIFGNPRGTYGVDHPDGPDDPNLPNAPAQTLAGKRFAVYKLFFAENSDELESINYMWNPVYSTAIRQAVYDSMTDDSKPSHVELFDGAQMPENADDVTEYMAIDYFHRLDSDYVYSDGQADPPVGHDRRERADFEQKLEGPYSKYRYFVEELREKMEGLDKFIVDVVHIADDNSITLTNLDYGYYLIDELYEGTTTSEGNMHHAASLIMTNTANPCAAIHIKSDYPSVKKQIREDEIDDWDSAIDEDGRERWNDIADFEIGQTVPYRYISEIPDINGYDSYYYAWHDKMDEELTFNNKKFNKTLSDDHSDNTGAVKVVIKGFENMDIHWEDTDGDGTGDTLTGYDWEDKDGDGTIDAPGEAVEYVLAKDEFDIIEASRDHSIDPDTFRIVVNDIKAIIDREFKNEIPPDPRMANPDPDEPQKNWYFQEVIVTFTARVNEKAADATGRPGLENKVRLEFSNDADHEGTGKKGFTPWDAVVCFTYQLEVLKTDDDDNALADAHFRLYSDASCENEVYVRHKKNADHSDIANEYVIINRDAVGGNDHEGGSPASPDDTCDIVTTTDGEVVIYGLDSGTYWLQETDAPAGYRLLTDPIMLTVIPTFTEDRDGYVAGEGASDAAAAALMNLEATAHVREFFEGGFRAWNPTSVGFDFGTANKYLDTDFDAGEAKKGVISLTIINRVQKKLPVTGTHALLIIFVAGVATMSAALFARRKRPTDKGDPDYMRREKK